MAKIKCLICNQELESKAVHDFQQCSCMNRAHVDGGSYYARIGAQDLNKVYIWDEKKKQYVKLT